MKLTKPMRVFDIERAAIQNQRKSNSYEVIYHNRIIGYTNTFPTVGESLWDHIIWEIDYNHRIIYCTD